MDGANITQYTSGGAAQMGSMPGIPIPNADTIQEFKVQTSQYDAGYGRNAGANVDVITKGGSNQLHGTVFEFNRNNFFNANDFFFKRSELSPGGSGVNTPQALKQKKSSPASSPNFSPSPALPKSISPILKIRKTPSTAPTKSPKP